MVARITQPAFNLREKLANVDGVISYERFPPGTIIQITEGATSSEVTQTTIDQWDLIYDGIARISPRLPNSKIVGQLETGFYSNGSGSSAAEDYIHIQMSRNRASTNATEMLYADTEISGYQSSGHDGNQQGYFAWLDTTGLVRPMHFLTTMFNDYPGTTDEVSYGFYSYVHTRSADDIRWTYDDSGGNQITRMRLMEVVQ
tara:strand:- start:116 stop:718 length:603 start_codon:yes stop_codon:yes gene_type:complete